MRLWSAVVSRLPPATGSDAGSALGAGFGGASVSVMAPGLYTRRWSPSHFDELIQGHRAKEQCYVRNRVAEEAHGPGGGGVRRALPGQLDRAGEEHAAEHDRGDQIDGAHAPDVGEHERGRPEQDRVDEDLACRPRERGDG